jgi:hypothetical protein
VKIEYLNKLILEALTDTSWRLQTPFYVRVDDKEIVIPEGFETDLASVPRVPIAFLVAGAKGNHAAVIHDWLYSQHYNREWADSVFYNALRHDGVGFFTSRIMFAAVRMFGGSYYRDKQ